MKKRIPIVLDTDQKIYDLAVENMISEGGPVAQVKNDKEQQTMKKEKEEPLH